MKTGYFLIADILGFSQIVTNLTFEELDKRINEWVILVKETAAKYEIKEYQLLSDTLFLSIEGQDNNSFKVLINFCKELLVCGGLEKSIPIKGSYNFWRI